MGTDCPVGYLVIRLWGVRDGSLLTSSWSPPGGLCIFQDIRLVRPEIILMSFGASVVVVYQLKHLWVHPTPIAQPATSVD